MTERDTCPYCGSTFKSIKESGLVGCEHCYYEIEQLSQAARSLFDGGTFSGRPPKRRDYEQL